MNTNEARIHMRDLALGGVEAIRVIVEIRKINFDQRNALREYAASARSALSDAGFPGEATWRALQRAAIGLDTGGPSIDPAFWQSVQSELEEAVTALDSLLGGNVQRDSDMRIVG
ncbi:MAG: hypothetical protein NVS2B16_05450 [Chloroflexota bacterium]